MVTENVVGCLMTVDYRLDDLRISHGVAAPMRRYARVLHVMIALAALVFGVLPGAELHAQDVRGRSGAVSEHSVAVAARNGMVVAQERLAAEIGADILKRGGNAVDAAVATGFAMAVTYPRAGNLGGGGFMLIHRAGGDAIAIDYRETAPAAATRDMFLGADGRPDSTLSRDSALGIGVPGTVAGLALALEKFGSGKFTLGEVVTPAIALARDGITVTDDIADTLPRWHKRLARWPASARLFSRADGESLGEGDRLIQTDLAATLEAIAAKGPRGFYEGPVADRLVQGIRAAGGIMTVDDLRSYQPVIRTPVRGRYRGYDVVSMPLPSSGGIVLLESLNILEGFDLPERAADAPETLHLMIEAMKRAYADRARYLGDSAFSDAPLERLLSKDYAARQRSTIDPERATPAAAIAAFAAPSGGGDNTTHFSVVDADGNAVSNTYTLNFSYGVGLVAEGTGVLLNNELDDFTAAPGASNAYGLVGFAANLPGPGKRPLSSMTPAIVLKDGRVVLVTGSPGGSRISSAVLQVIVNMLDHRMDVMKAVARPRLHHQWLPDEVRVERGFDANTLETLRAMGHHVVTPLGQTSANSIAASPDGGWLGAADPRTRGATAAGY
jgi:gamma-glutamyltranspeptidase/glutathione hydrolase